MTADIPNSERRSHTIGVEAWMQQATAAMQGRNLAEAIRCFDAASAVMPEFWPAQLGKARCLAELGDLRAATGVGVNLADKCLGSAGLYVELGLLLSRLRQFDKAILAYERALALEPDNSDIHFSLATLNRYVGALGLAAEHVERCLARNPRDSEAQLFRSQLKTATSVENRITELGRLLDAGVPEYPDKSRLLYALAKEYEDLGQYDSSMDCLQRGASIRRRHMRYSVEEDERVIQKIIDTYDWTRFLGQPTGHDSSAPIFILGMPRSGSTLVERMLSSHAEVSSIGEVNHFAGALVKLVMQSDRNAVTRKIDLVEASTRIDWQQLGESYLRSAELLQPATAHFIDKLPLNFLYTGLIRLALPNARIIHVVRHPIAACHSIYKHWFKDAYPFSYDLTELGRYYCAYARLMRHWKTVMPSSITEVSYEQLVEDPRGECERLLAACGLPWDERCLAFHENSEPVMTASAAQVRRPLYRTSVDSWRHVERQLSGLRDLLESEHLV